MIRSMIASPLLLAALHGPASADISLTPAWQSPSDGVPTGVGWADFDEDGLYEHLHDIRTAIPRKLFYLGSKAIHAITSVQVDGVALHPGDYCCDLVEGWISLAKPLRVGGLLRIGREQSTNIDLAVTTTRRIRIYENKPQIIPENVSILILPDDDFGANYNFESGRFASNIRSHFERYGWKVTVTGLAAELDSCSVSGADFGSRSVQIDVPVAEITDLSSYDGLTVMPGRDHDRILSSPLALGLVRSALEEGLVVSAWCRAVRVLAAADVLRGKKITGHADYRSEYEAAGAIYLGDDVPPVIDGSIVTYVRSRFYRTETCEAIADAISTARKSR
jgi:putative intracellular protease/amidase